MELYVLRLYWKRRSKCTIPQKTANTGLTELFYMVQGIHNKFSKAKCESINHNTVVF